MKTFLLLTITAFVFAALAAISPPQPLASPAAPAQTECGCKNLKTLQIELRNALHVQQAMRNKIPELREKGHDSSQSAFEAFAKGEATRGLEAIPNYTGPQHVDYYPWGRSLSEDADRSKHKPAELCRMIDSSANELAKAKQASECTGIAAALDAHENWHISFCTTIGFLPYEAMHGADRAKEEVEAYEEQIKVLRAEIAKVLKKNCTGYSASGKAGDTVFSGVICSFEKPFVVKNNNPFIQVFDFLPSSATNGTWSFSYKSGVSGGGGGQYTIEGTDTEKPVIILKGSGTATAPVAGTSSGTVRIDLVRLESNECDGK